MKTMRLFPLELKRLLQSRLTWLMMALTVLSPVLGLVLYKPATSTTMLSMYLANPAIAGGVGGAILFGLLTIFELDRACRSRVDILTDAVVSPLTTALTRLLALLTAAVLTVGLTMLVWLPISAGLIGSVFTGANYVLAYLLLMGLALPLGVLAAAAAYQFTRRADLSIVLFIAFCALSLTVWASDWQLCWLNPCVWALSDDFSNFCVSVGSLDALHLAPCTGRGLDNLLSLHPAIWEGRVRLPGPERPAVLPPGDRPGAADLFRRRLCRPALYRPQQPGFNGDVLL